MTRRALLFLLGLSATAAPAVDPPARTATARLNGHTFTLPEGFEIELVAGPPLVHRPVAAAFDDQGHLFVTESSGTNDPVKKQLADKPHRLLRLVDADGDGRFDTATVFADKLMLPQGVMCLGGSVFVGNPPEITKFTDADGDGKAEKREVWFDGKTLTGCANDLHGPYPGPDGWVYWTKGAFARQDYTLPNGRKFTTRASHIFRAKPDGTGTEPVMTGGMDNPVDVAFTPAGDRIFTTTFLQHPGGGKRDGLIHAVYGGVYGKDHDPVHEHPWTSPNLLPPMTHLGAAAPCGLHRYESEQFGDGYRDNLFACCFNMRKVTRHVLIPDGATVRTFDSDFLTSNHLDFHPTDVTEDADGSLLVVDTGGWYKLCCPTSQLVKPDVSGGIYRVRRKAAHKVEDPRGAKIDWPTQDANELTILLEDPRPAVRRRAVEQLGAGGEPTGKTLAGVSLNLNFSALVRLNAVWALARIDTPAARTAVRYSCADNDAAVRRAALHVVSLWRDRAALPDLLKLLGHADPHTRRGAAEALGRIGDKSAVPALLAAHKGVTDRVLQHSLTFALIEIADPAFVAAGLKDADPAVRRAALTALDQMPNGGLTAAAVTEQFDGPDAELQATLWWLLGRHSDWGSALVPRLRERLAKPSFTSSESDELRSRLARLAANPDVQKLIAEAARPAGKRASTAAAQLALHAMATAGLKKLPAVWLDALAAAIRSGDDALVGRAVATVRAFQFEKAFPPALADALRHAGESGTSSPDVALAALAALPDGLLELPDLRFATLLTQLDQPYVTEILSKARLTSPQLVAVAGVFKKVGPMAVGNLLNAFVKSTDEAAGLALVADLADPKVRPTVRAEVVKPILDRYPSGVRTAAAGLYAALDADRAGQRAKLELLLANLTGGDVLRGRAVFNGAKAACASCHAIGYLGGTVGPDLTRIGGVRGERDLLEAIVFPSASFVRSYEPVKVTTFDGRTFNGILKRDAPDEVVLTLNATEEVRIPRRDIDELTLGMVSVMPSGLDQQLSPQELADLIAFLKAAK